MEDNMRETNVRYTEILPEDFSIKHKITAHTEKKTFHLHKQPELIFPLSDNLKCKFEGGAIHIPRNSILLLDPMNLHYIYSEEGSGICDRYVLYFSANYLSSLHASQDINLLECFYLHREAPPLVLTVPETYLWEIRTLLEQMDHYHKLEQEDSPDILKCALHTKFLFGRFMLFVNQFFFSQYRSRIPASMEFYASQVYEICEYIQRHYEEDLSVEELTRIFPVSKTQLYYIFKRISGVTVSDYLTEYRISQAKELLINSDLSVEMISQKAGYKNISSFSRIFKQKTAYSPLQYRKKYAAT